MICCFYAEGVKLIGKLKEKKPCDKEEYMKTLLFMEFAKKQMGESTRKDFAFSLSVT